MAKSSNRLCAITIDAAIAATTSTVAAQDRALAIHDVLEGNHFNLSNGKPGPYRLHITAEAQRLVLNFSAENGQHLHSFGLSLKPFQRTVRDYLAICDSYIVAINSFNPQAIEAIDMARRGLHNEGAELLMERLKDKATMDNLTARRLFTLVCAILPAAGAIATVPPKQTRPRTVLFVCTMNAIRSPMAAAITHHYFGSDIYAASAGISAGDPDPFVSVVMDEIDIDLKFHRPHSLSDEQELQFDLVVTLSDEAELEAQKLPRKKGAVLEHWALPDPSMVHGRREQILDAYRALRDDIIKQVKARFV
ncbi:MAG: UPF0262 family protein [Aestuariivirga sp.]